MTNKQKDVAVVLGVVIVISLILITHPDKKSTLYKSSSSLSKPVFPTLREPQKESMQALLVGELSLEGKCLKVGENLIVWPYGFSVDAQGDKIKVLDEEGKLVAEVGDSVKLGGGQVEVGDTTSAKLSDFVSDDCDGPLWITGQVLPSKK